MSKSQKIVWSFYLLFIIYFFLKSVGGLTDDSNIFIAYLVFGWIPFLIAHFIWKDKKA